MISRRLLRIKTLQVLYAFYRSDDDSLVKAESQLSHSIRKAYDLYHFIMLLLLEIRDYNLNRIEIARQKYIPTPEDLNPNLRFVQNSVLKLLESNEGLKEYLQKHKLSWVNHREVIKNLYLKFAATDTFSQYMNDPQPSFEKDRQILIQFLSKELLCSDDFEQSIEEQSIFWVDDLEFMVGMVVKTLKEFREGQPPSTPLLPMYRSPDDEDFAKRLLFKTIANHKHNITTIDTHTKNWDVERIATMDIHLMELAITEIIDFPSIPVKVSFNEYIEISKYYSTSQSSNFINGVLDKIIMHLRSQNRINKQGRGLIGEAEN